jgi:hypothetical protein
MIDNSSTLAASIAAVYQFGHRRILALAERLTDEQLQWRLSPESLPIAFHLWHVARWADYMHAAIPGMTPELRSGLPASIQIWEAERLDEGWEFAAELGYRGTGMQMDEETAASLRYPAKELLVAYARRAFAAVSQVVAAVPPDQMEAAEQLQPLTEGIWVEGTVGSAILEHIVHDHRHLGAMECLLGLQTGKGSASV